MFFCQVCEGREGIEKEGGRERGRGVREGREGGEGGRGRKGGRGGREGVEKSGWEGRRG